MRNKILIAEDQPDIRLLVQNLVAGFQGYSCTSYNNGAELDSRLGQGYHDVALVITDNDVPQDDIGLNLVWKYARHSSLPFILMSGQNRDHLAEKAIEAGAQAFVLKPFKVALFRRTIQDILDKNK